MIEAYAVEQVRAAEAARDGRAAAEGTLMHGRPRGLADVVAVRPARARLRPPRRALVGAGDNGGDALYAGAAARREGVAPPSSPLSEHAARGRPGRAADGRGRGRRLARERGRPAAVELVEEADVVLDGIVGIGGRPGLPPAAEAVVRAVPDESMVIAVDLPSGVDPGGRDVRAVDGVADVTVTFGAPKPAHLLPGHRAARSGCSPSSTSGSTVAGPAAVQRLTHDDVAALLAGARPRRRQVLPRRRSASRRRRRTTRAPPLLSVTAAVAAGAGMVRYVGAADADRARAQHRPGGRARRRAGSRPGWSGRDSTPPRTPSDGRAQRRAAAGRPGLG